MPTRTVLISGASIAGPALAHWLRRYGIEPVVIERSPALRPGGQTVDLRGAGRTVAQRMGIEDAVRAAGTGERGVVFVDAQDRVRARVGAEAFGGEGPVAELEVLRGDLAAILHEHTRDEVEYVFGDRITDVEQDPTGVRVRLASGAERAADLLVGADGIGSATRNAVFDEHGAVRPLGMYSAWFTIPATPSDGEWARWYNAPGGRTVLLRPDNKGTTVAALFFLSRPLGLEDLDPDAQRSVLRAVFGDAGWEIARVLDGMDAATDLAVQPVGQVKLDRWSRGRVALVGDAGYCASPVSGMGTSLALVGAYVLAGELARHDDVPTALTAYERVLRPYAERAQKLPPGAPRTGTPRTAYGIAVQRAVLRFATTGPQARLVERMFSPPAEWFELPAYG